VKSIRSNILAFAVLATLVPSVGLGLMSFVGYQDVINRNVDYELLALAKDSSAELTTWIRERSHDLRTLSDLAETQFPEWRDLFVGSIPLSGWGHAYRYPGLEEEPPPDRADVQAALKVIDQLISHLRGLIVPSRG